MVPLTALAWCLYILVSCLIAVAIVYYFSTSTLDKWEKLRVPYVKPVVPLFGNFMPVALGFTHPIEFYRKIYNQLAGHEYGGLYQMRTPYLMIRDPELVNNVFIKNFSHFSDRGIYSDFKVNPYSDHLFFMNNPQWKMIRTKLTPAFSTGKLKVMYQQIEECGDVLMENIDISLSDGQDELEIKDVLGRFSTDVIGTCAFGLKLNTVSQKDSPFHRYGKSLFDPSMALLFREICLMISPMILYILKIKDFPQDAVRFFRIQLHETMKYREDNNVVRNDFVHVLMQARRDLVLNENLPKEERFTETQMVANAIVMFSAGFETVSSTLSFCLYELALKKKIQDKLRSHIQLKLAENDGKIDYEFILDLNYLDMVIAETLRMHPVLSAMFRKATQDYQLPDESFTIEKGQLVILPIQSLHYDPKYYPDPGVFDPERFSPEEKAKRISGTYFPFGDGPRMCIAKRFAELEMRLALVKILTKFEVEPCERTQIPITYTKRSIVVGPENGIWLKFKRITG